ncbi:MAG: UDP-glucose--hexose-1-phosphate uridylyltransferase [Myxococcales bacterium]|nr:UDP-glucose--hexose-1-phosphate uridylyltransferase [Myxococcales bacterium]
MSTKLPEGPHRRYNPLLAEWVLCSPHRLKRPWQGQVDEPQKDDRPAYDPTCYLCPGNTRANGEVNPPFAETFAFTNDFAALMPEGESIAFANDALFQVESQRGVCRVICFSPRHDLTIPRMETSAVRAVIDTWAHEVQDLGAKDFIRYVQVFENKGAIMGCSNPHPHCQVWASEHIPEKPRKKRDTQRAYLAKFGNDLLGDYLERERALGERIICENEHFTALVPFWAVWPFEVTLIARRRVPDLPSLTNEERDGLADLMRRVCVRYDNLFSCSFPYSMGFYGAPTDGEDHGSWRLHAEYYPPLVRSASVKKFQVGYEMTADPQRDLTAEQAAARIRDMSEVHYLF